MRLIALLLVVSLSAVSAWPKMFVTKEERQEITDSIQDLSIVLKETQALLGTKVDTKDVRKNKIKAFTESLKTDSSEEILKKSPQNILFDLLNYVEMAKKFAEDERPTVLAFIKKKKTIRIANFLIYIQDIQQAIPKASVITECLNTLKILKEELSDMKVKENELSLKKYFASLKEKDVVSDVDKNWVLEKLNSVQCAASIELTKFFDLLGEGIKQNNNDGIKVGKNIDGIASYLQNLAKQTEMKLWTKIHNYESLVLKLYVRFVGTAWFDAVDYMMNDAMEADMILTKRKDYQSYTEKEAMKKEEMQKNSFGQVIDRGFQGFKNFFGIKDNLNKPEEEDDDSKPKQPKQPNLDTLGKKKDIIDAISSAVGTWEMELGLIYNLGCKTYDFSYSAKWDDYFERVTKSETRLERTMFQLKKSLDTNSNFLNTRSSFISNIDNMFNDFRAVIHGLIYRVFRITYLIQKLEDPLEFQSVPKHFSPQRVAESKHIFDTEPIFEYDNKKDI